MLNSRLSTFFAEISRLRLGFSVSAFSAFSCTAIAVFSSRRVEGKREEGRERLPSIGYQISSRKERQNTIRNCSFPNPVVSFLDLRPYFRSRSRFHLRSFPILPLLFLFQLLSPAHPYQLGTSGLSISPSRLPKWQRSR